MILRAVILAANACLMSVEIVAGRIVAPHLGASIYTWTSVIGVVLAGIAVGSWLGGRAADRRPIRALLAAACLAASVAVAAVLPLDLLATESLRLILLPWPARVAAHVAVVFFLPSLLLAAITPVAAAEALAADGPSGRTLGGLYAWAAVGSIAGTFLTGFWLIDAVGAAGVLWGVSGLLASAAAAFGAAQAQGWIRAWTAAWIVLALLGNAPWSRTAAVGATLRLRPTADPDLLYRDESPYARIDVHHAAGRPDLRILVIDKLHHSYVNMSDPSDLGYGYEKTYAAMARRLAGDSPLALLQIGGGAYVFPRHVARAHPGSRIDVVEIDPAVTRAGRAVLGLPAVTPFSIHHEDGRVAVARLALDRREGGGGAAYDLVCLDAFRDYAVPWHLTTVEFVRDVREILTPGGVYLMNLVDSHRHGAFLAAEILTLERVFAHVEVLGWLPVQPDPLGHSTFVLYASDRPLPAPAAGERPEAAALLRPMTVEARAALLDRCAAVALTDDRAPVERLLAPVERDDGITRALMALLDRARERARAGDAEGSGRWVERARRIAPDHPAIRHVLAHGRDGAGDGI